MFMYGYQFPHTRMKKDEVRKYLDDDNPLIDEICNIIDDSRVTVVDTEDLFDENIDWDHSIYYTMQQEDARHPLAEDKQDYKDATYHYRFVNCDIYEDGESLFKSKSVLICYQDEDDTHQVIYIFDFCDDDYPYPDGEF